MRFLITNDDGIDSVGIQALKNAALRRGHTCFISAPLHQCSANSQHITLFQPLKTFRRTEGYEGCEAYAVDGTPADCVRISQPLFHDVPIDFVLSGINWGENVGAGIYYSGTLAAAREASMMYYRAIAVSIVGGADEKAFDAAAERAVIMAEQLKETAFPRLGVINLNFPATDAETWGEMKLCPAATSYFHDRYKAREDEDGERVFELQHGSTMEDPEEGTESYYLRRNHPTCTFLTGYNNINAEFAATFANLT